MKKEILMNGDSYREENSNEENSDEENSNEKS